MRWGFLLWLLLCSPVFGAPQVLNLVEPVVLVADKSRHLALMDTGASLSSMDRALAKKRGYKVLRYTRVRSAIGTEKRPVVEVEFILKGHLKKGQFSLSDRSKMKYKILMGRNILKGYWIAP